MQIIVLERYVSLLDLYLTLTSFKIIKGRKMNQSYLHIFLNLILEFIRKFRQI